MMDIKFKYERDLLNNNDYVLTAKISFGGSKLYLWDTTIEEAYTRALQLSDIETHVEWDWGEDDDDEDDNYLEEEAEYEAEYEAYKDEELRVCRDECLEDDYKYKYSYKADEGYCY
jgi:hypothetical protein